MSLDFRTSRSKATYKLRYDIWRRANDAPNTCMGNFTFMLPCIVIDFFLNNQKDATMIQIYSVIKLYMFRASTLLIIRSFSAVHSALISFMQVFDVPS